MGCISKLGLFILNFVVFAVGVAIVALASIIINKDSDYGNLLLSKGMFTVPVIVLIIGLIIVIIGFLGCCGALKENSCMLKTYAFIVAVLLISQIVLGILLLVYSQKAEDVIKDGMEEVFEGYGKEDLALTKSIDQIQHDLKCCGVSNYTDWRELGQGNDVTIGCCKNQTDECVIAMVTKPPLVATKTIYTEGCFYAIKEDIQSITIGLGVACLILAAVEVMSISCACGIAKKSKHYA
nr:CD63 antigen-like [Cherax quadricarinatus]